MSLPGDPVRVAAGASALLAQAEQLLRAVDELRSIDIAGTADALAAVRGTSAAAAEFAAEVREFCVRVGTALSAYAAEMARAHLRADRAEAQRLAAERALSAHAERIDAQRSRVRVLREADIPLGTVLAAEDLLAQECDREHLARLQLDSAEQEYAHARAAMERAAETAAAQIGDFPGGHRRSTLMSIAGVIERGVAVAAEATAATSELLASLWAELKRSAMTGAALTTVALLTLLAGAIMSTVAPALGGVAATAMILLVTTIAVGILADAVRPTPRVSRRSAGSAARPDGIGTVLAEAAEVDDAARIDTAEREFGNAEGTDAETVVKITKIGSDDGVVRWRVALPSTQEWRTTFLLGDDAGATNDVESNLALMLAPTLRTQYERAVLDAMAQAGVAPDDPVMLVGFSQGGIMAAHLAAYNSDYDWSVAVVSGAPIDNMPIPARTTVISVQHRGDPVHLLDAGLGGIGAPVQREHWTTIVAPPATPGGGIGHAHSARVYATTLHAHAEHIVDRYPHVEDFFATTEAGSHSAYYTWQE